jgi:energy-coupling factor transporter ATP-binding protein EcfA2
VDFIRIQTKETKTGLEMYPDFVVGRSKDLMVQGRTFYAIWDEARGLWSRDEYDVQRLVDEALRAEAEKCEKSTGIAPNVKYMKSWGSASWAQFRKFLQNISDSSHPLDAKLIFANTDVKKTDYASMKLPYALGEGSIDAWDEMLRTLYSPEERAKIEWAIGSIVAGDSKKIQKFFVFYGPPGTGKSTVLNIIQQLFQGYTTAFDGKALGNSNSSFATEVFKNNPLVAIQHDGDLSKIEDNARLNSIIAHEEMTMNEKYKPSYTARVDAILLMGSNQPVRISDAKSGIIRRLIDIHPTGVKLPAKHYSTLMGQIDFELGAIAQHCLDVYLGMGKNYYNAYRPMEMMLQTDVFFNYIEASFDVFKSQNYTTIKQAYSLYKEFCEETGIERPLPQYKFREELRNYFDEFKDRGEVDGQQVRSLYLGFTADKFKAPKKESKAEFSLVLEESTSLLDEEFAACSAQLAGEEGTPVRKWSNNTTVLSDIDTTALHFVKPPANHVVIDFDLKADNGTKALERNLEAASRWPPTYAEVSKSGDGVHLHYVYTGDVQKLGAEYAAGIEVKHFPGDASLRRRLSRCNAVPVARISSGLPLKQKKETMLSTKTMTSEAGLRCQIERNLKKEIHPGTKPSIDFIKKILDDAHESGMKYDVSNMRGRVMAFANNSSNQAPMCLKIVTEMKWASEAEMDSDPDAIVEVTDDRIVFFDVEVYPNLFVVCWKYHGSDEVVTMINPKAHEVEALTRMKLVGFYNRRYDNHIIYAATMGLTNAQLFQLSSKLVDNNRGAPYAAAYSLSYADIWDFSSKKQSLKKFEIDLGIHHMEMDLAWDQPVPEDLWEKVCAYCRNDVMATEATFEDRKGDFVARQILAELSGKAVNDTTQNHTAKIIFGDDKHPQKKFKYTDLSEEFPGYKFEMGKSSYKGEDPSEGGYVYAEPGLYENVAVLDVASMHPSTIEILNLFGPYTPKFAQLREARVAIKRKEYEKARGLLDGRLEQFLVGAEDDASSAEALSYALKIVINIVYGLTSAKFDNPFRDIRNVDNIVAKRGALFMIDLKLLVQEAGYTVAHVKTDSIKIPGADKKIIRIVEEFGKQYGYEFEHEDTYDKFCLVNDAVYIAGTQAIPFDPPDVPNWKWTAVGAQFAHPYVFKSLFSKEPIEFDDYCEAKSVNKGAMYLDRHQLTDKDAEKNVANMRHIGKTGRFVPVTEGGGVLYRVFEDKFYAVSGTKGFEWMEADVAETMDDKLEIDMAYFEKLKQAAIKQVEKFGRFEDLVKET